MPELPSFHRYTFRVVLLKVSPIVVRLISVPDDLSLDEFHEVLQLAFGWRRDPFYTFRIHGQQISRRRHLRTRKLSEFQLRRQEKFLYTYDPLSMWEWEIRLLDIEPGSDGDGTAVLFIGTSRHPSGRLWWSARLHADFGSA